MKSWVFQLILFGICAVLSIAFVYITIRLSEHFKLYDSIDERKIHTKNVSRLGGVGIFAVFAAAAGFIMYTITGLPFNKLYFSAALLLAFFTGFADDIKRIRARYKLLLQIGCGILVVASGLTFSELTILSFKPVNLGVLGYIATVIWVVAFMNAVNLIDGMDGLSMGVTLIANLFLFIIACCTGNTLVSLFSIVLGGAILGFYVFNFPPAKIFLGDGGAYFIGFVYAVLPLMGVKKSAVLTLFLIPMVLMLVPIMDVLQVMYHRRKNGRNIFLPDRTHLHHRLMNLGFSTRGILFVIYAYSIILGLSALLMVFMPAQLSFILFAIIGLLVILSFYILSSAERVIEKKEHDCNTK